MLWPAVHEKAISDGTFLIFDVFPSIGNLFLAVQDLLQVRTLSAIGRGHVTYEVSLVLNIK